MFNDLIQKKQFLRSHSLFRQGYGGQAGQSMILTVLVLSSAVLSLSAIGGYMMLVRLRVSSDIMNTTKAIYIADAGIECEAYNQFASKINGFCDAGGRNEFLYTGVVADPDASYVVQYTDVPLPFIVSKGIYRSAGRSFRLDF